MVKQWFAIGLKPWKCNNGQTMVLQSLKYHDHKTMVKQWLYNSLITMVIKPCFNYGFIMVEKSVRKSWLNDGFAIVLQPWSNGFTMVKKP